MLYVLLIIVCCLCGIWKFLSQKKLDLEPPEQSGKYPIIGHALQFINNNNYETIIKMSEESLRKGGVIRGSLGKKYYGITDPEVFFTVSNICLDKEYVYDFIKPFTGEGLVTANVSTWKRHRKLLNPAFNQQVLNSFIETFNNQARALVDRLAYQLGKPFDHEPIIRESNLETLCQTAINIDVTSRRSVNEMMFSFVTSALQIVSHRLEHVWLHIDFIYNWFHLKKTQDIISKQVVMIISPIIEKKRTEIEYEHKNGTLTNKMKPFLELMLDMTNTTQCFTEIELRDEIMTLIAAGYETSPTNLNLALIALGSYRDVQEKVYNEIIQVCGGLDQEIDKDDLSKLVYTEAVLKETLRLYPTVPVIARRVHKDIKLKNYTLKRGCSCFLSIYGLNRHPVWGPDANEFKPERWLDTATLPDMKSFGSFGVGKRNCIGRVFSIMSMKITLAHVIRRYRVSADISKLVLNWHISLYPESGQHYTLELRE